MSRQPTAVEVGLKITDENSIVGITILQGSGLPGGDTGPQDDAGIGSLYARTDGTAFIKKADADAAADWFLLGDVSLGDLVWRQERVIAATDDSQAPGAGIDITAWTDNESGIGGDEMVVGDHVLVDCDGTPVLLEMTAKVSDTSITLAAATGGVIGDNDTFMVQNYLPDSPAAQEKQAIIHFPDAASACIKIADFNWAIADGINLAAAYAAVNGSLTNADTVNSAIEKLDGNQQDIQTSSGLTQGDVNYGTFTGDSLADSQTSKALFQRAETLLEQLRGVEATGITAEATFDSVVVDDVKSVMWLVQAFEEATPANVKSFEVHALHNGTAAADATLVDDTVISKLKLGSNFDIDLTIDINGATTAQVMRLRATSATAGITVTARRVEVRKSVL